MHHPLARAFVRAIAIVSAGLPLMASAAAAQRWQTVDVSRQLFDTARHRVRVEYGAGRLDIGATNERLLYLMHLRYNEANGTPLHVYDGAERSLRLGINGQNVQVGRRSEEGAGELRLSLSRKVPIDLTVDVGAAKATLELGGLRLTDARIHTGAAEVTVGFNQPNTARLETLEIEAGAASVTVTGVANANTSDVRVTSGVGNISLRFDGTWTQDVNVNANVAVGRLHVAVPKDVGIRVDASRVIAAFDHPGLIKRDDAYYSDNWETARFKLRLRAQTAIGAIEVERIGK
jgi:hypothetical protein